MYVKPRTMEMLAFELSRDDSAGNQLSMWIMLNDLAHYKGSGAEEKTSGTWMEAPENPIIIGRF